MPPVRSKTCQQAQACTGGLTFERAYSKAGNPAYIALYESDFTKANGLLSVDPAYFDSLVGKSLDKLNSPNLEKALEFLDDKLLPATSNAVERGNRRVRKMQKTSPSGSLPAAMWVRATSTIAGWPGRMYFNCVSLKFAVTQMF